MKRLFLLIFLGMFLCISSQVFAQVKVDKREIKLELEPGKTVVGSITVENRSDKNIPIKTELEDFTYPSPFDGRKKPLPLGSMPRSCAEWISVSPAVFELPPRGKREVNYSIKVPKQAKGGYYGVLFFKKEAEPLKGQIGARVAVRVGCSFFLETPDKTKKAKIEDISVASSDTIQGYFSNVGDVLLISKGNFYAMNEEGIVADRGEIREKEFHLFPEEKAPFTVNLSKELALGRYTLVINFDLGQGDAALKEVDFSKDAVEGIKISKVRD